MIETMEQAINVQKRRAEAKRRGYAKAVRRFLLRANGGFRRGEDCDTYTDLRRSLPVNWTLTENQE